MMSSRSSRPCMSGISSSTIIGGEFVYCFDEESKKFGEFDFLAQGTLYSDVVESGTNTAQTIKTHHNVGGLPKDMKFKLIEPLRIYCLSALY